MTGRPCWRSRSAPGLFAPDEAEALLGQVADPLVSGALPPGHAAVACRESRDGAPIGWSYVAPDPYADRVWNVWWIGVSPAYHARGVGQALLSHIEQAAMDAGVRVIVIETSDQAPLARARMFYAKRGYEERGRVPDFYAAGDAKVIFTRTLPTGV